MMATLNVKHTNKYFEWKVRALVYNYVKVIRIVRL